MKKIVSNKLLSKNTWVGIPIIVAMIVGGLISSPQVFAEKPKAVDDMYKCIDNWEKLAEKNSSTDKSTLKFRSMISERTKNAIKERKAHLNSEKFSNTTLDDKYQKLDNLIASNNKNLRDNKAVKPEYHVKNIKIERDSLLRQLDENLKIASDKNTSTEALIQNHCETSWGLRAYAVAGRKWHAQMNNDTLSARNAIAKAYWIEAQKPKSVNPISYDKDIGVIQNHLDKLIIPSKGIVKVSTLNPKNGDTKTAFKELAYGPQKNLSKNIASDTKKLKKMAQSKIKNISKKNKHGYVQLPADNKSYYIYGSEKANSGNGGSTPSYQRYGSLTLVKVFQNVATQFHKKYPEAKLVAGDLNAISGHATHKNGIDMDVYVQNYLGADMRGNHRNGKSIERSVSLGKMFMNTKKIDVIFYNDSAVNKKVNAYTKKHNLPGRMEPSNSSHEFHFHVRVKAKSGPYDSCAQANAAKNCFSDR